ncbi:MAG: calcium/sodium antiporter [Gemmatimonadota bacterium]|nr:calcium/sodium antiporter [Gemmatimonadota bacterium]
MLLATLELAAGLIVLFVGGHFLVQGATALASLARISTAVVALTVVAIGTSLPELAVSMDAAARGSTDMAYGNIIGSCIFNIGAILGVTALIAPIMVQRQTIRLEYPTMVFVVCLALVLAHDAWIDRLDGGLLVLGLMFFVAWTIYIARRGVPLSASAALERDVKRAVHLDKGAGRAWVTNLALVGAGMVALATGAELSVAGGVTIAQTLGVEERVIGLTVIAMGTSLPELATCIVATRQGEQEIALGNIVGSNIFNLLGILGLTATLFPVHIHERALALDNWVMLAFALVLFPMMLRGRRVSRLNALLLLIGFVTYMAYVVVVR